MLQIIKYEEQENDILVGFRKYNFVVYGMLGKIERFTKRDYLQKIYEQCKSAIDYETERYNQDKPNSIITEEEGEEFIPDVSNPVKLEIDFKNLEGRVLNQYDEIFSTDIKFIIDGTDKAIIENKEIIESEVSEDTEYSIVAKFDSLEERQIRIIKAQVIQDEIIDEEKIATAEAIIDLDMRLSILEGSA